MVDDLDDLLPELETKHSSGTPAPSSDTKFQRLRLLTDADNVDEGPHVANRAESDKIKCCPPFIAGTNLPVGLSNLTRPKTCSALHCRNCDFKVMSFLDFEWTENVEYLFLRTNMPGSKKVFEKLRRKTGSVAYACHCVAYSARERCSLHLMRTLPWFCRGHDEQN